MGSTKYCSPMKMLKYTADKYGCVVIQGDLVLHHFAKELMPHENEFKLNEENG